MNKRSKDYIPYACEIEAARAEAADRVKNIPDPRHEYLATYSVNGTPLSEHIWAYSLKEAAEHVNQQLGMVGWFPQNLKVTAVSDTVVNVG